MEKIGSLLKEKRLEAGLTIEEVSSKTRLTTKHIRAIEEGDISYFRDDLSYLRYFLRSYCDVLHIDFDEIKDDLKTSIDSYTSTTLMEQVHEHEQIEKNISKHAQMISKPKTTKKHRKPDMSLVSLVLIVVVILAGLTFAFVVYVLPNMGKEDTNKPSEPNQEQVDVPKPEKDPVKEDNKDKEDDKKVELKVTEVSSTQYVLENVKIGEDLTVEIEFKSGCWFQMYLNDVALSVPESKVYNFSEKITYTLKAEAGQKIGMRFGYMADHVVKVNGVEVKLNPSITGVIDAQTVVLEVKGA